MSSNRHTRLVDADAPWAITTDAVEETFVEILLSDDEWVRREFDELMAAGWGGVPPPRRPRQRARWPRRPGPVPSAVPVAAPETFDHGREVHGHQRGPPFR